MEVFSRVLSTSSTASTKIAAASFDKEVKLAEIRMGSSRSPQKVAAKIVTSPPKSPPFSQSVPPVVPSDDSKPKTASNRTIRRREQKKRANIRKMELLSQSRKEKTSRADELKSFAEKEKLKNQAALDLHKSKRNFDLALKEATKSVVVKTVPKKFGSSIDETVIEMKQRPNEMLKERVETLTFRGDIPTSMVNSMATGDAISMVGSSVDRDGLSKEQRIGYEKWYERRDADDDRSVTAFKSSGTWRRDYA